MIILDFLFYFSSLHFASINSKYGIKKLKPVEGARNLLFISTFLWLFIIFKIINYFIFHNPISLGIHWTWIMLISITIYGSLNYIYVEKKRFNMISERENGLNRKFKISEKSGRLIAILYVYTVQLIIIIGLMIKGIYISLK